MLARRANRWITQFEGVNERGEQAKGNGEYLYRESDEPWCYELTYRDVRHVGDRANQTTSLRLIRPRLTAADLTAPAAGKEGG